jgi:hypothetical protein
MLLFKEIVVALAQFVYYVVLVLFTAALILWTVGHRKINAVESARAASRDRDFILDESDLMASQTPPLHVPPRRLSFSATTPRSSNSGGDIPVVGLGRQFGAKGLQELGSTTRRVRFSLTPSQESRERRNVFRDAGSTPYRSPGPEVQYQNSLIELFPSRKVTPKIPFDSPAPSLKQLELQLAPRMDDQAFRTLSGPHQEIPAHESLCPLAGDPAVVSGLPDSGFSLPCSDQSRHEEAAPKPVMIGNKWLGSADCAVRADANIRKTMVPEHGHSSFEKVGVSGFEKRARLLAPGVARSDFISRFPQKPICQRVRPNAVQVAHGGESPDEVSPPSIIPVEMQCSRAEHKENLLSNQALVDNVTSKRVRFGPDGLPQAGATAALASERFSSSKRKGEVTSMVHVVGENVNTLSEGLLRPINPAELGIVPNSETGTRKSAKYPVERKTAKLAHSSDLKKQDCMDLKESCGMDVGRGSREHALAASNCKRDGELSSAELEMARRVSNILLRVAPRKLAGAINRIEDARLRAAVQSMLDATD